MQSQRRRLHMRHPSFLRFVFHPKECCRPARLFLFMRQILSTAKKLKGSAAAMRNVMQDASFSCGRAGERLKRRASNRQQRHGRSGQARAVVLASTGPMHAQSPTPPGKSRDTLRRRDAEQGANRARNPFVHLKFLLGLGSPPPLRVLWSCGNLCFMVVRRTKRKDDLQDFSQQSTCTFSAVLHAKPTGLCFGCFRLLGWPCAVVSFFLLISPSFLFLSRTGHRGRGAARDTEKRKRGKKVRPVRVEILGYPASGAIFDHMSAHGKLKSGPGQEAGMGGEHGLHGRARRQKNYDQGGPGARERDC